MPARTTTHPKKATTHSHYSVTQPWPMPPPVKPWGKNDKDLLGDYREGRALLSRRQRSRGQASALMCCHRYRPTGRRRPEKRRSNASCRRGDQGIAAAVTAALAQLSGLSKRVVWAGAALTASYRRASMLHAGPRCCHGRSRGRRGRNGNGGGEENRGEAALIPLLVGL
jgi:hypothetical protein